MAAGRDAVRMSDEEIASFLASQLKVQVATLGPEGWPHLTTLFYVYDEGQIAWWTYARSQKVLNLRRDPRLSVLVESGDDYDQLRGVSMQGTARLVEDYDSIATIGAAVVSAMAGGVDLGELGDQIVAAQATKRVGVVFEPTRVMSWDHTKMSAPPGPKGGTHEGQG